MYKSKSFEQLGIQDDFIFGIVMRNPEHCKTFLETVLGISIKRIEYPENQKTIGIAKDAKSVRLDIYANDEAGTVYNVEMQNADKHDLPRRSRYYQGMIDLNLIERGSSYTELPCSIIIFICTFDYYGKGKPIYRFENMCSKNMCSDTALRYGDDTVKIILNTKGIAEGISEELRALLQYIDKGIVSDTYTETLEREVQAAKRNEKWRREYMLLSMKYQEIREDSLKEGRKEGREEGLEQGIMNSTCGFYQKGKISLEDAVEATGLTAETFLEKYEEWKRTPAV